MKYYSEITTVKAAKDLFLVETMDGKYLVDNVTAAIARLNENININNPDHVRQIVSSLDANREKKRVFSPNEYIEKRKLSRLMLYPTNSCNLRCIYCHCNSSFGDDMTDDILYAAVDKYCQHVESRLDIIKEYGETPQITFMGGGEPFLRIGKIKEIVEYFTAKCKYYGLQPRYVIVTNTTLGTDSDWQWLVHNGFLINLSLDGPPEIQDRNRPIYGGHPSSPKVINRLKYLSDLGATCHVRSTVLSAKDIDAICSFFEKFSCVHTHALEPCSLAGRAKDNQLDISEETFYTEFFEKYSEYLFANPSRYKSSWFKPFKRTEGFCGAVYCNAIVHPSGTITLCSEVGANERNNDIRKQFVVGNVKDVGSVYESDKAITFSKEHSLDALAHCRDCVIKYKCGGGCYIKRVRDFDDSETFWNAFCRNAINLNISYLIGCLDNEQK